MKVHLNKKQGFLAIAGAFGILKKQLKVKSKQVQMTTKLSWPILWLRFTMNLSLQRIVSKVNQCSFWSILALVSKQGIGWGHLYEETGRKSKNLVFHSFLFQWCLLMDLKFASCNIFKIWVIYYRLIYISGFVSI